MGTIDWTRANDQWQARVVTPDRRKVNTGYAASKAAADDIKRMIGWTTPPTAAEPAGAQLRETLST
jgi:hypothetical protein